MQLDNLYYANDLAPQSHTQQQMQEKTTSVAAASEAMNISAVERQSTGDLVAQSTPTNVRPVIKEPRIHKRASTAKQQGAKPECTGNPGNQ
ncbi:unnamed protein product [Schistosoma margrebowiei]|uniref:Uncharacterized protein n=1 Tax=Schistosoma margrebowiei TaxID=48269 RepID=A0A183MFZ0_9TREM|nr:unnamed protein product [Schistosoma margrebowiei]